MSDQQNGPVMFMHTPFAPLDPIVDLYTGLFGMMLPWEYTGWRSEQMAWKDSCYLNSGLSIAPTYTLTGPDTLKFLDKEFVNNFKKFKIGRGKHGIMCYEDGTLACDGVIVKTGENEYYTNWIGPYLDYRVKASGMDVTCTNLTGQIFLFQLAGPKSLTILEMASKSDLHDVKFMDWKPAVIGGKNVHILRMGMGGSLAYEVHGSVMDVQAVYNAIWQVGEPLGMRKLGLNAYMMDHTENGYPQAYYHFTYPWNLDEGFKEYCKTGFPGFVEIATPPVLHGSAGPDLKVAFRNPVELGWAKMINFDHEFTGKAALQKIVAENKKQMVTLKWNAEDILDIHASQFQPGEHYAPIEAPNHPTTHGGIGNFFADKVLDKDGKQIGLSSGRCYSYYYRAMLSLCPIDTEYSQEGTEVVIVWGDPGTRQKMVRATVERFPYHIENRNQTFDVESIPRPEF